MDETSRTLPEQIAESIRRQIASGDLKPADRLPPVREQARTWECTPGTVSRAYAMLARDGLVVGRRGAGTRVAPQALQARPGSHPWASLVNRSERFLIESLGAGFSPGQVEAALSVAVARWKELQSQPSPAAASQSPGHPLRFFGSHDILLDSLTHLLAEEQPEVQLHPEYVGSLGGLMALARGEADIAGVHLWDAATDTYNTPFVQRVLPGRDLVLLGLAYRALGLIVPPGNPHGFRSLTDLDGEGVRLANRQAGSGTRVWLDEHLKQAGIKATSIPGYQDVQTTHLGVAQQVATGGANVGLGIQAAASAYGLDFVPLAKERYDLVVPEEAWKTAAIQRLKDALSSPRFHEMVDAFGGYDSSISGQEIWLR